MSSDYSSIKNSLIVILLILVFSCREQVGPSPSYFVQADSILSLARSMRDGDDPAKSIRFLDSAYQTGHGASTSDLWKKFDFKSEFYLYYQYKPVLLRRAIDSMYQVLKGHEQDNEASYIATLFRDGDAKMAEGLYQKAFDLYYSGRSHANEHLDRCKAALFTYNLAIVRYRQQQYREAISLLHQCLRESDNCMTDIAERVNVPQNALNTIALSYENMDSLDSALIYYKKAVQLLESRKNEFRDPIDQNYFARARGVVYGNLGGVYVKKDQPKLAERYLKASIQINQRPNFEEMDAVTAEIKLAGLYLKTQRFHDAANTLSDIDHQLRRLHAKGLQTSAFKLDHLRLQWLLFENLNDTKKAYTLLKQLYQEQESSYQEEIVAKRQDMDIAFRLKDQQFQLELLEKNNRIKQQTLIMMIGFAALFAFLLVIVWQHLKRSSKQVKELKRLNQIIGEQHEQTLSALHALEESHQENTRLLQVVAHDLRSPLSGIPSLITFMRGELVNEEEKAEMLTMIQTASQDALDLVNDLLQSPTIVDQSKKQTLNLASIVKHCIALAKTKARNKNQHILFYENALYVWGSREKLWRVVSNLLNNAIKFSGHGSTITLRLHQENASVRLSVEDEGIGIDLAIQAKLFDINAGRPGTDGEESFGLGLVISKQIIDAHGGKIGYENKESGGTIFFIELPHIAG